MMENNLPNPKRTREEIRHLIEQWEQSGQSKRAFCTEHKLNYMTFVGWSNNNKRKKVKTEAPKIPADFVPLKIKNDTQQVFAEVFFKQGGSVLIYQIVTADYIRNLIR